MIVWTLAGGRIDHRVERSIVWHLPLVRALMYYHCALRSNLAWTVPPSKPVAGRAEELHARVMAMLPEMDDVDE